MTFMEPIEATNLPALIDRATQRLASARTSAEVLEARHIAEAALHYARVTKAANETHADCLRMIVRAEMRMADEIDAGQARGEVARAENGRPSESVRGTDTSTATLDDLGVSRQRLSEWRDVRDAGNTVVETAIQDALVNGRAPTKSDIRRAVDNYARREETTVERESRESLERSVNAVRSFLYGWPVVKHFNKNPRKTEILQALDEDERQILLRIVRMIGDEL